MPKRKMEIEYINYKIKKLKKKLKKRSRRDQSPASTGTSNSEDDQDQVGVLLDSPRNEEIDPSAEQVDSLAEQVNPSAEQGDPSAEQEDPSAEQVEPLTDKADPSTEQIDPEVLDILGSDPSAVVAYGADINKDLATRLQHITTVGLDKEIRKELAERYLIPANSVLIGAPQLNAEIKAALTETVLKRDKGIEGRQSQLATAISGLARVVTEELQEKKKNKERLKQLMDVCRILCNIQYAESVTRRNFAIFSINKDLKEHLTDTKIDRYLFGENLAETIRTAKAVAKSGTEMKTKTPAKPKTFPPTNNLNWRSPAPARKQQGVQRGRGAAPPPVPGPTARYNRNTMQGNSSKPSRHPSKFNRRR